MPVISVSPFPKGFCWGQGALAIAIKFETAEHKAELLKVNAGNMVGKQFSRKS